MKVLIIFAHPSHESFTYEVYTAYSKGLIDAGHSVAVSDLYEMNFKTDMSLSEYNRESYYKTGAPIPDDVLKEQEKLNECDAVVFIYPVFWSDCPAKLKGWFDRVWTYGFAYGNRSMNKLEKALVLCTAGRSLEHLQRYGHAQAMEAVMLGDRILDRARESKMVILGGMSREDMETRSINRTEHLGKAYELGLKF